MDALQQFDIILDLSRTEQLYDYVEQKMYNSPASGKWDLSIFRGKGLLDSVDVNDENGQVRVDKLDKCIADKRILEKKSALDKDKSTDSKRSSGKYDELDESCIFAFEKDEISDGMLPRRIIPIHKGGDVIKGHVVLKLDKPLEADKLVIGIQGRAFVKIRIYYGKGAFDLIKEEIFVKEKTTVWEKIKSTNELADEFSLLSAAAPKISRSKVLPEGTHYYPFEFAIPADAAQSTVPLVDSYCNRGDIMYRIKATIDKGNSLARGSIVTHKGLWLKRIVDIAQDLQYLDPIVVEEKLDMRAIGFWKAGQIKLQATLPRSAFLVGEPVPITLDILNESSGDINWVSAYIRCIGKAKHGFKRLSATVGIDIKSEKVKEGAVPAGSQPVYKWLLPWNFNCSSVDGPLMPVGTIDDCQYIEVRYEVCVKVKRKGLHRDMELNIPIVVGNLDSKGAVS